MNWTRMVRFRALNESSVFSIFLASKSIIAPETKSKGDGE
jgi:hypothetical protein